MNKIRLDQEIVRRGLAETRSQAGNIIHLGYVEVDGRVELKPGHFTSENNKIKIINKENYVSRAGLKLSSVADKLRLDFNGKIVLDVGSSTGGFTDYALQNGAARIIAVDVGTNQMHPKLINNKKIELHEKTDIRNFNPKITLDIILMDVSFISARLVLPHLAQISGKDTLILAMVKPQFEATKEQVNRGIIKNERMRRQILKDFEVWIKKLFKVVDKIDSDIAGAKGNVERFYLLRVSERI